MKNILVISSLIPVFTFALATAAQFAGLVSFPGLNPTVLIGGLVATGVLAFALRDYTGKPSFRARPASPRPTKATPARSRTPAAANCDWTYSTRAA